MIRELSPREKDIATLMLQNYGNNEIANILHLSPKSVGTRICRIYSKAGISGQKNQRRLLTEILTQLP